MSCVDLKGRHATHDATFDTRHDIRHATRQTTRRAIRDATNDTTRDTRRDKRHDARYATRHSTRYRSARRDILHYIALKHRVKYVHSTAGIDSSVPDSWSCSIRTNASLDVWHVHRSSCYERVLQFDSLRFVTDFFAIFSFS